jgi:hypothetical protein
MRPPRFSIGNLLWLVATSAVVIALPRWLGRDAAVLEAPFCGAFAGRLLARTISESARLRWLGGTFAGGVVTIAVCLSDLRGHVATARDHAVAIPVCLLYGLVATAALEGAAKMLVWLGEASALRDESTAR